MRINYMFTLIILTLSCMITHASDIDHISLGAFVWNDQSAIPAEASSFLCGRMQRTIAASGYADNKATGRFALVAKCDVVEKDIAPTTPPRISQKLELSFAVVDLIENKVYGSCAMTVSGIGTTETKAFSTAFQKISTQNQQLKSLLADAKEKILDYYANSCSQIQTQAKTFAATGEFDKAIFSLMSVPAVCSECYNSCQQLATEIYQQKIASECNHLLEQAKSKWALSQSKSTATEIAELLGQIDPRASNFESVVAFRNSISKKLAADAKRQWNIEVKKHDDNQLFKRSIVDACRSVGEAFANNFQLPKLNIFKYF